MLHQTMAIYTVSIILLKDIHLLNEIKCDLILSHYIIIINCVCVYTFMFVMLQ